MGGYATFRLDAAAFAGLLTIVTRCLGHSLVGYVAHNWGRRDWQLAGHAVQGFNGPGISLLTTGEAWHNNHRAFPGSARLGLCASQFDPGWCTLVAMRALGLVWDLKQPADLPATGVVSFGKRNLPWVLEYSAHQKEHHASAKVVDRLERADVDD